MTFYLLDVQPVAGRITRCTLRVVLIRENCRNSVALSLQQLPADISFDRSVSRKKYPHKQSPVSIGQSVFSRTRLNISSVTSRAVPVIEAISGSLCAVDQSSVQMRLPLCSSKGEIRRSEERRVGKECRYRWLPYH